MRGCSVGVRKSFIKPHTAASRVLNHATSNLPVLLPLQPADDPAYAERRSGRCPPLSHQLFDIYQRDQLGQHPMMDTTKLRTNAVFE
jgi:hypothetical protein